MRISRPVCPHCQRPQSTCICSLVTPTPPACEVLILQHPLEEHHAKNSARLLHLSLPGSRLVVLDATWRKSRKMLHLSPALQRLPRLALVDAPQGRYAIRKAHKPGQLSTLEATCAALAQLEGDAARWQPLLDAFDRFVARQQAFVPN